jgi:hypothetical protein
LILHISCGVVDVLMRHLFLWPRSRCRMASPVRHGSRSRSRCPGVESRAS